MWQKTQNNTDLININFISFSIEKKKKKKKKKSRVERNSQGRNPAFSLAALLIFILKVSS